jgi:hypothetical protein
MNEHTEEYNDEEDDIFDYEQYIYYQVYYTYKDKFEKQPDENILQEIQKYIS